MQTLTRALWRYGGMIVRPRSTAGALRDDEGAFDGVWLGLLYVLGVGVLEILRGVAAARVTADLGGALMLLATVGRVLVVPIVVLVACETALGRTRAHRRGLMLAPLLLVVSVAHELAAHGWAAPRYVPEIAGGVLSVALALWVRSAVAPRSEEAT
ncbi:MAG: hypothetical protein KDK70_06170 [Myxococcales bacterium]|nr:hypothetical protein [Myxococcales bacterium]